MINAPHDAALIALVDQRIRASVTRERAVGTCVTRATTGPFATVIFDGSSQAVPVKVPADVNLQEDDRCLLDKYGTEWVVAHSFNALGFGESSRAATMDGGPSVTSGTFIDVAEFGTMPFTKFYDSTFIRIGLSVGGFATANGTYIRWGARITPIDAGSTYVASDHNLVLIAFSLANQHHYNYRATRVVGVPAGNYNISLRWRRTLGAGTGRMTDADEAAMEADEQVRSTAPIL